MGQLSGKVVLVSGTAPGRPCDDALAVAREGARVVLGGRDGLHLAALAAQIAAETGADVRHLRCDPLLTTQCRAIVDLAAQVFGGLDCLVHHIAAPAVAGHNAAAAGARRMVRAALPLLSAGAGSIVFVAPPYAGITRRSAAAYLLAREVGRAGVRVNTVVTGAPAYGRPRPGVFPRARVPAMAHPGNGVAVAPTTHDAGCAAAVVHLAAAASPAVTGHIIDVTSGWDDL